MTNLEIGEALKKLIRPGLILTCGEARAWQHRILMAGFPASVAEYAAWPGPTERARLESEVSTTLRELRAMTERCRFLEDELAIAEGRNR